MPRFDKYQIKKLKDYLYRSNIHDARFENSQYDREKKILFINVVNPIYDVKIHFTFYDVKVSLLINGKELGNCETIISLSVEEDYSYMQNFTQVCGEKLDNSLYLLFQMFSGDEFHIISREVLVDIQM